MPDLPQIAAVLHRERPKLLAKPNVVATGIGYKVIDGRRTHILAAICSVAQKVSPHALRAAELIPRSLGGDVLTDVVATGPIKALQARTQLHRPAPGGVSIGHLKISAGTLGCLVERDREAWTIDPNEGLPRRINPPSPEIFILSNNHVLANSNAARRGDAILQPGVADGGVPLSHKIASLEAFVPISFKRRRQRRTWWDRWLAEIQSWLGIPNNPLTKVNRIDAALARPLPGRVKPEILELGVIAGLAEAQLGQAGVKSGRTTAVTRGEIIQVDVTVDVEYGAGKVARFHDQLLTDMRSAGGDSGSAVLDDQNRLVGLLFAGSDTVTVVNRIEHVVEELKLTGTVSK